MSLNKIDRSFFSMNKITFLYKRLILNVQLFCGKYIIQIINNFNKIEFNFSTILCF